MANDKVQTEIITRKTVVRKGIQRTLNTAKFESIVITYETEEEIEWSHPADDVAAGLKERDKKIRNWETLFLREFRQSHDRILAELDLSHKKAYFKNNLEDKQVENAQEAAKELDSLDSLD